MSWAEEELGAAELGDARRSRRLVRLVERVAEQPSVSIPAACSGAAETKAAYRLLSHEALDWRDILAPHLASSLRRMAAEPVVLCLQDTTELDFNAQAIAGLGPLSYEAQRGMYLHATYAVSAQRVPLGVLDAWMWAREAKPADGRRGGLLESVRWVEGYERLAELAAELPATRLVCVGDRESDLLALLVRARELGHAADYLVRCQHNRVLPEGGKLWDEVMGSVPLGRIGFELPAGRGRKARVVQQQVRVQRVRLADRCGGHIEVTSTSRKGTTFALSLPAVDASEAELRPASEPKQRAVTTRKRICVVDDEARYAESLRMLLGYDHDVALAPSAERALELLSGGQAFDVIVCDLMMPGKTGMDLHDELTGPSRERMIFLTGGATTERAREFLARPDIRYLEKPVELPILEAMIEEVTTLASAGRMGA